MFYKLLLFSFATEIFSFFNMSKEQRLTIELPLGRHLAILTKMYYGALTMRLQHLELERHYSILMLIAGNNKKYTQKELADVLKIDKASMVGMIDYLVKKGYLARTANPKDRREYWLELTAMAIKIIPEIKHEIKQLNKMALNNLSKKENLIFNRALCTISANLNKLPADKVIINYKKAKKHENH